MATTYDENGLPIEDVLPPEEAAPVPDKKAELLKLIETTPPLALQPTAVPLPSELTKGGPEAPYREVGVKPPPSVPKGKEIKFRPEVDKAIVDAATKLGMDPNAVRGYASIESGGDPPSNINKRTQYKGLFNIGTRRVQRHRTR